MDAGIVTSSVPVSVERDVGAITLINGNLGLGLTIGPQCMQIAIDKAKQYGIGCVIAKNSTHYGIAGYYASMAAEAGCVGFSTTNARPSIAPTFGTEGMMGTNPLCFGQLLPIHFTAYYFDTFTTYFTTFTTYFTTY